MDIPARADLFAIGRDYVTSRSTKLDPAQVDLEGSDANLYVGIASVLAAMVIRQLVYRTSALMLDGAEDEDLDRYVFDRYQLTRKGASPAVGTAQVARPTALAGGGTVPAGTRISTDLGFEYVTTEPAVFSGGTLGPVNCNVRAVQAGKASQAGARALKRFAPGQSLFDSTLTVTNADPTAGGEDVEKDEALRDRARDFWRSARRGILAAIESGAKSVPGVDSATAVETLDGSGRPARVVDLYIADSTGVASRALADLVDQALREYRAGGIAVLIHTSVPTMVSIQLALKFEAGVDTRTLTYLASAAVMSFVNGLPTNGVLYRRELGGVLLRFKDQGLLSDDASIVAPAGDLVPAVGQTIRTTLDRISTS